MNTKSTKRPLIVWNWGTGIALTFIVFCALIIAAVVRSFQEDVFLVTDEYYKEELVYQQRIDQTQNASDRKDLLTVSSDDQTVKLTFGGEGVLSGQVHFYRPDNPALDRLVEVKNSELVVSKEQLTPGKYTMKVSWKNAGVDYYREEAIFIN